MNDDFDLPLWVKKLREILKEIQEEKLRSARDRANPRPPKVADKTDSGSAFDPENR